MKFFICILAIYLVLFINESTGDDLYKVLGVKRTASQKEIKQAYKQLAREWHPDKNNDENAADVFTKINEAYETLGDSDKRLQYDKFGYTSAREPQRPQGHHHQGFFHGFDAFDNFFRSGGFNFGGGESIIDKYTINQRTYDTKILPESYNKPCFMYAYTDFCFECSRMEHHVEKFIKELEAVGLAVGTFHAGHARGLSQSLRVYHVPVILAVINGRTVFFKGIVNSQNLRDFARGLFPRKTLLQISDSTFQSFVDGTSSDNHMRAILFGQKEQPPVRFLAPAFHYKDFVKCAYVHTHSPDSQQIVKKFGINKYRETLLMFNEEPASPVATISMQQLPRSTLDEVIEGNKFLQLPRLSSQLRFDEICPEERLARRKKLCVILFTKKIDEHQIYRETFRKYVQRFPITLQDRVKFAYIYEDVQQEIVKTLNKESGISLTSDKDSLKVVILWRMERQHTSYDWVKTGWNVDPNRLKECEEHLEEKVRNLLHSDQSLSYRTILPEFYNEHALGLAIRILYRLYDWGERVVYYFAGFDVVSVSTILLSFLFMFGMGYFMHKMAAIEDEQVRKTLPKKSKPRPPSTSADNRKINLYEINDKSYEDLVINADTGLTFTILVDEESKQKLLKNFGELVHPYTRYSALTFAFISLDFYLGWYRHLLEESVDSKVDLSSMRLRNCIGTVLAINGFRKYYYIYQPRKARSWMRKKNYVSSAIGFNDSEESSGDEGAMTQEELLTGLIAWMDRVFDGSVRKIRIPNWPEFTIK